MTTDSSRIKKIVRSAVLGVAKVSEDFRFHVLYYEMPANFFEDQINLVRSSHEPTATLILPLYNITLNTNEITYKQ